MSRRFIEVQPIENLESILGYQFRRKDRFRQALTHSSAINENHPNAFREDNKTLAFVGDAILKYTVARHIFENGRDDIRSMVSNLHDATLAIIPNKILADIAKTKLHLTNYLIRGNSHPTPSDSMYATCLEAIFGAIALEHSSDEHETVFSVIQKICTEKYGTYSLSKSSDSFLNKMFPTNQSWIMINPDSFDKNQIETCSHLTNKLNLLKEEIQRKELMIRQLSERSSCATLGRTILWILAFIGLCVIIALILFLLYESKFFVVPPPPQRRWYEF